MRCPTSSGRLAALILVLTAGLVLTACEEGVDPLLESDRHYSLYGFLNMNRDTQYVRVDEIRPTLRLTDPSPLDARVTSTDQVTGEVVVWRDSVFAFSDGTYAHLFYAPFRVIPTHTYRLLVERGDGATTWVETRIPDRPQAQVQPAVTRVVNQATLSSQAVVWEGITREPDSTAVWYRFFSEAGKPLIDEKLPPKRVQLTPEGLEVQIDLTADRDTLLERVGRRVLLGMGMTIILRNAEWDPPGEGFDPRVLSQPGVFSNVRQGFGFVGAAGAFSVEWVLDEQVANRLGYPLPGKTGGQGE